MSVIVPLPACGQVWIKAAVQTAISAAIKSGIPKEDLYIGVGVGAPQYPTGYHGPESLAGRSVHGLLEKYIWQRSGQCGLWASIGPKHLYEGYRVFGALGVFVGAVQVVADERHLPKLQHTVLVGHVDNRWVPSLLEWDIDPLLSTLDLHEAIRVMETYDTLTRIDNVESQPAREIAARL
jgi:hypothetical protein